MAVGLVGFVIDQSLQLSNSISANSQVGSITRNELTLPDTNFESVSID